MWAWAEEEPVDEAEWRRSLPPLIPIRSTANAIWRFVKRALEERL